MTYTHAYVCPGCVGAGRLYIGDIVTGSVKLMVPILTCLSVCCLGIICRHYSEKETHDHSRDNNDSTMEKLQKVMQSPNMHLDVMMGVALCACGYCLAFIWWLVDIALFALNAIADADGKTLQPMYS